MTGYVSVMLVKEVKARGYQGHILAYVLTIIGFALQCHLTEFKYRIPQIFEPGVIFIARIKALWMLHSILIVIGQTKVFYLLCEVGSSMMPIKLCLQLRVFQYSQIKEQLGTHQVAVARLQQWPINKSLVLRGEGSSTPSAIIRRKSITLIHIFRVEGKETSIELCGPLTHGIASQHISEQGIVACHLSRRVASFYKATLPECIPPLARGSSVCLHGDGPTKAVNTSEENVSSF